MHIINTVQHIEYRECVDIYQFLLLNKSYWQFRDKYCTLYDRVTSCMKDKRVAAVTHVVQQTDRLYGAVVTFCTKDRQAVLLQKHVLNRGQISCVLLCVFYERHTRTRLLLKQHVLEHTDGLHAATPNTSPCLAFCSLIAVT